MDRATANIANLFQLLVDDGFDVIVHARRSTIIKNSEPEFKVEVRLMA